MARRVILLQIPGSNAAAAARLALEHKGFDYVPVDLPPFVHRAIVRALGFPRARVPAAWVEGRRAQGSRGIPRVLEELRPEPPLYPSEAELRERVEEAERWGEEWLQPALRRMLPWSLRQQPEAAASLSDLVPLPPALIGRLVLPAVKLSARWNDSNERTVRGTLAALPGLLDRVDSLIADGVIGGTEPNAADFQIASTVRTLMFFEQLRPWIASRPAGQHALRFLADMPGHVGPVLPEDALPR